MIPNRLIFIWLGPKFPWSGGLAIRSAYNVQKPQSIWLVHEGLKQEGDGWDLIKDIPGLEVIPVNDGHFEGLGDDGLCGKLFHTLTAPASRANLLRLALLFKYGGVYLDTDIIMTKPFGEMMELRGFVGTEPVALPASLFKSINPFRWAFCGMQFAFRELCARMPGGYGLFRSFEGLFTAAVNNAVIGAEPGNETIVKAFEYIKTMPEEERLKRFRLGTRLLQNVTGNKSSDSMEVVPAPYFYPLGPEVSAHWFKNNTHKKVQKLVLPETRVVHWYNSVEGRFLKTKLSKEWVDSHPNTAFSELARIALEQAN
ncbi:glycosyltransferase [Fibrobacter sp. UWEL]|uniref:glycosyltransferase n=1 Tax=Fibrobacter sp. UWEL TaxID=1896209 RepID=UPI000920ACA7|nr:glycosyltransferase [Fibrobacter sp. UWEL]SHK69041.1 Glycosyltransferase sugar-binding region containing DXD motif-containing protein [Fibrobacter sp. UWEL]